MRIPVVRAFMTVMMLIPISCDSGGGGPRDSLDGSWSSEAGDVWYIMDPGSESYRLFRSVDTPTEYCWIADDGPLTDVTADQFVLGRSRLGTIEEPQVLDYEIADNRLSIRPTGQSAWEVFQAGERTTSSFRPLCPDWLAQLSGTWYMTALRDGPDGAVTTVLPTQESVRLDLASDRTLLFTASHPAGPERAWQGRFEVDATSGQMTWIIEPAGGQVEFDYTYTSGPPQLELGLDVGRAALFNALFDASLEGPTRITFNR